jgi:ATP-dependent DNA helicase DinG
MNTTEPTYDPAILAQAGDRILGPTGLLAQSLPGYEPRDPQMEMANLVGATIAAGLALDPLDEETASVLIEAGTGTGKSLAYLIPAILSRKRCVVSTETIALQEQLVRKDLPFLKKTLGIDFTFAIAKGRSNYYCLRNALALMASGGMTGRAKSPELAMIQATHAELIDGKWEGDKSSLNHPMPDRLWATVAAEESCTGSECEHADSCPYLAAKTFYFKADVIVTNHTFYGLSHQLRHTVNVEPLPSHWIWIADEAHTLPDKLCDVWSTKLKHTSVPALLKRLRRAAERFEIVADLPKTDDDALELNDALFELFRSTPKQELLLSEYPPAIFEAAEVFARELWRIIGSYIDPFHAAAAHTSDTKRLRALDSVIESAKRRRATVMYWFTDSVEGKCRYAEIEQNDRIPPAQRAVTLCEKPIDPGPLFEIIRQRLLVEIHTSATLAAGGGEVGWRPVLREFALPSDTPTMRVESPFDYPNQVRGYFPRAGVCPDSKNPDYHEQLCGELERILHHTKGRAFVLFTSNYDLRAIARLIRVRIPYQVLVQGEAPKEMLVAEFKRDVSSVLLGTKTFWTGVDIPGEALSCVIITKIPFPVPTSPMNAARCAAIKARGGSDFVEFSLPRAIQDIRQGFGRLIRTQSDRGLFVLLDPRMSTARYAAQIRWSLPNFAIRSEL